MDADTLRSLQAPIKNKYKEDPNTAIITLRASGELDDQHIACKVETGRAMMVAGGRSVQGNRYIGEDGDAQAHRQPQGQAGKA